jgi:hypothetical protein
VVVAVAAAAVGGVGSLALVTVRTATRASFLCSQVRCPPEADEVGFLEAVGVAALVLRRDCRGSRTMTTSFHLVGVPVRRLVARVAASLDPDKAALAVGEGRVEVTPGGRDFLQYVMHSAAPKQQTHPASPPV